MIIHVPCESWRIEIDDGPMKRWFSSSLPFASPRLSLHLLWVIGPCARLVASNYHSYGESPLSFFWKR